MNWIFPPETLFQSVKIIVINPYLFVYLLYLFYLFIYLFIIIIFFFFGGGLNW